MNQGPTRKIRQLDPARIKDEALSFAKIGLYRYRIGGEIVEINQAALDLLDLRNETPGSVIGRDIGTFFKHIEEPGTLRRATLEKGEVRNFEYHYRTLSGEERWVYHSSFLVQAQDTDEIFVQVISRDITDIKQTAVALHASNSRYRALAEISHHGIAWVTGDPPRIDYANEALATILAVDRSALIGASGDDLWRFVHPDDLPALRDRFARRLAGEDTPSEYELRVMSADGAKKYVLWTVVPIDLGAEPSLHVSGIDITARRREEETRRKAEEALRHRQKLESLGVLAGGIAHDFNNLLTAISGACELALMGMEDPQTVRRHLLEVRGTTDQAAELCRSLLAYAGNSRIERKPVSLNALVKETVPLINVSKSKKAQLRTALDSRNPAVLGDTSQLRQILLNLITNASEALTGDAGTIRVATTIADLDGEAVMQVNAIGKDLRPGRYAVLKVSDTGVGMDPETVTRIFDPFFTTKSTGRGLGLAAVLGIVKVHSGGLGLETSPGMGSTFSLYLPLLTKEVECQTPKPKNDLMDWAGGGLALVADDEKIVLSAARTMLEMFGFEVVTASDGRAAIRAFNERADEFKVAFLDVMMPELDGLEVFKCIRTRRDDLPILMTSGYDAGNIAGELEGHGRVDFLPKPYRLETLADRLKKLLG